MRKLLLTTLGLALIAVTSQAQTIITFQSPPYSNGALAGQNGWITPTASSTWTVATAGTGIVTSTLNVDTAILTGAPISIAAGSTRNFSVDFTFGGGPTGTTGVANAYHLGFGLTTLTTSNIGLTENATSAQIWLQQLNLTGSQSTIRALTAGFSPQTSQLNWAAGDNFRLNMSVILGVSAATSSYTAQLTNLTSATTSTLATETNFGSTLYNALVAGSGASVYFETRNISEGITSVIVDTVVVPEPSTFALLGLGSVGLIALRRRRR